MMARKKSVAADTAAQKKEAVDGIYVKTIPGLKSFRRAGFGFNQEGFGIALSALNDAQVDALEKEPNLVVEHCTFKADDEYVGKQ